jgi:hypothetical protein
MPVKSKETKGSPEAASYESRDTVLGKVRGYPPWPAMVRVISRLDICFAKVDYFLLLLGC